MNAARDLASSIPASPPTIPAFLPSRPPPLTPCAVPGYALDMRRSLLLAALPILALACAPPAEAPPPAAPPQPATMPAQPPAAVPDAAAAQALGDKVVAGFIDTWNRHDMDAFAAMFSEDAVFVNIFGMWSNGRKDIRDSHAGIHQSVFKQSRIASVHVQPRFVSPDIAVVRWVWTLTGVLTPEGQPAPDMQGTLMHVVRREGDGFRIVATQNTAARGDAYGKVRGWEPSALPAR